jgi:hypothetical protein
VKLLNQALAQTLDFDAVETTAVESAADYSWLAILIAVLSVGLSIFIACRATRNSPQKRKMPFKLSDLPAAAKLIPTFFLITFFFVHIIALTDAMIQSKVIAKNAHEYFHYMKYSRLLGLSHAHLFGHAVMYTLVATPFAFTNWKEFTKALLITLAMIMAMADVGSWWLIKYFGEEFEIISMVSGMTFTSCFLVMAGKTLKDLWKFCHPI